MPNKNPQGSTGTPQNVTTPSTESLAKLEDMAAKFTNYVAVFTKRTQEISRSLDAFIVVINKKTVALSQAGSSAVGRSSDTKSITSKLLGIGAATEHFNYDKILREIREKMEAPPSVEKELEKLVAHFHDKSSNPKPDFALAIKTLAKPKMEMEELWQKASHVVDLSQSTGASLILSADTLDYALEKYEIKTNNGVFAMRQLGVAVDVSHGNLSELSVALKEVGPTAQKAGVSFYDTAQLLAILGKNEIEGAEAGMKLKQVIEGLAQPQPAAQQALKDLGVQVQGSPGKLDASETIRQMGQKGLDEQSAKQIFPRGGDDAALALTKDTSGMDTFKEKVRNGAAVMADMEREPPNTDTHGKDRRKHHRGPKGDLC